MFDSKAVAEDDYLKLEIPAGAPRNLDPWQSRIERSPGVGTQAGPMLIGEITISYGEFRGSIPANNLPNVREVVSNDAEECGNPLPSDTAIQAAERTLNTLVAYHPGTYDIWSTDEGEVEITVPVDKVGRAMALVCDNDGGLTCFVNIDGRMRRMKDYNADDAWLSSDFIPRALADLATR
ncbi:MAG: hypothetical protein OXG82_21265 [Gammaproteobacteria bacterium]|nr:hypothetical protein [Gammaproteobacteria bacterium]